MYLWILIHPIPSHPIAHAIPYWPRATISKGFKQSLKSRALLCLSQYEGLDESIAFFREECCVNDKRD